MPLVLPENVNKSRCMKLVYAFRLCRSKSGKVIKLLIKRVLDATIFEGLDILLNPNFMREAGIYVHNLP